jgi:hypothetical protein
MAGASLLLLVKTNEIAIFWLMMSSEKARFAPKLCMHVLASDVAS